MRGPLDQEATRTERGRAIVVHLMVGVGLVVAMLPLPAAAQESDDDRATADIAGEWLTTSTITDVTRTGSFQNSDTFVGQSSTGRVVITPGGRVVSKGQPNVSFSRSGAAVTYARTYPGGVQCTDPETGEVKEKGPAFSDFTLEVADVADGVAQRLTMSAVTRWPNPGGECDPGRMVAHRTGEWVRVDGASAVGSSRDGTVNFAVAVTADPLEVAAGDEVSVPVTVSAVATAAEEPCRVVRPLRRPLTLDSIVLASGRGNAMIATGKRPLNPRGTTVDIGAPLEVTEDQAEACSHRMVAQVTATLAVPEDTAPGRYPLIPMITGLPRAASVDSGRLVLQVVAAPEPEETEAAESATEAAALPPPADMETIFLADTAGDVGNRAALLAILAGAAAAMFTRMRGRRLRAAGIFAGLVALGGGAVELVAGGLLGGVDVNRHLASGAFSSVTGAAMAGGFAFLLPWLSRPERDDRRAGPLIPVLLGVWVFALRAMDGVALGRAALAGAIALVIGLIAVLGGSRTRARVFGLVGGFALMVLTYMGAVAADGSGTGGRNEAIIALALGGAALLVAALLPKGRAADGDPEGDAEAGPTPPDAPLAGESPLAG